MKNFQFLPSDDAIKAFQNEWFLENHIAVILPKDRRFPTPREDASKNRPITHTESTRVVRAFRKSVCSVVTLMMKILKPCTDNLSFEAYHIDKKGIIIDKTNGRVVCLIEGDFNIIEIKNEHNIIAIKYGNNCKIIQKVNKDVYTIDDINVFTSMKEKDVIQNGEILGIFNVNEKAYSWDSCFYHKFVLKNTEAIRSWKLED